MESPICSKTNSSGSRIEIYRQFGRIVAPDGEIIQEFAAAHVRCPIDRARWPVPIPPNIPPDAIAIDRYGGYRAGRHTPHGVTDPALIDAIRAMQPADVSHMQNDDNGCGPAVVAALNGTSYAQAVEALFTDGRVRVLGTQRLADATATSRHACKSHTWDEVQDARAVAALIKSASPWCSQRYGHFISIDPDMMITDPELVLRHPLATYPRRRWIPMMYFVRE